MFVRLHIHGCTNASMLYSIVNQFMESSNCCLEGKKIIVVCSTTICNHTFYNVVG